jgi:sodium pump decarboxylase gamma subunit
MNVTLLTGAAQITKDSSTLDRLTLGGSTLLLGMAIVFAVLGIIFIALQIMRAVFTKNAEKAKQATKAEKAVQNVAVKSEEPAPAAAPAATTDDSAIVAAIVAAISAYTGKAPEGFRVVSFKKRK